MRESALKLTDEQKEKILKENWFSHDGQWFLKVVQERALKRKKMIVF